MFNWAFFWLFSCLPGRQHNIFQRMTIRKPAFGLWLCHYLCDPVDLPPFSKPWCPIWGKKKIKEGERERGREEGDGLLILKVWCLELCLEFIFISICSKQNCSSQFSCNSGVLTFVITLLSHLALGNNPKPQKTIFLSLFGVSTKAKYLYIWREGRFRARLTDGHKCWLPKDAEGDQSGERLTD